MSVHDPQRAIVVTHLGGVRFDAHVRSHHIVVDQPTYGGGGDTGPAPIELLGASLGTCVAFYVQQFCHTRGLAHEGLRVEVEALGARAPNRIGEFRLTVHLPFDVPAQYLPMLEHVARSCPAHNTLTNAARVSVAIESIVGTPR
jgi:putative redox protein